MLEDIYRPFPRPDTDVRIWLIMRQNDQYMSMCVIICQYMSVYNVSVQYTLLYMQFCVIIRQFGTVWYSLCQFAPETSVCLYMS